MERSSYFLPEARLTAGMAFKYFEAKCIGKTRQKKLKECVKLTSLEVPGVILAMDRYPSWVLQIPIRYN
jgi:hypothetical protein